MPEVKQEVKEVGRDSAWYFIDTLVYALLGMVAVPLLTKKALTPAEYGIYSLVVTTILVVSRLATQWIASAAVRFYHQCEEENRVSELFTTIFRFIPVVSFVVLAVACPVVYLLLPLGNNKSLIFITIVCLVGTSITTVTLGFLMAKQASRAYAISHLIEAFGRFILGVVIVISVGFGVTGVLFGWLFGILVALPVQLKALSARKYYQKSEYSRPLLKELWQYGWPLALVMVMFNILAFSDRYMILIFRDSYEVGLYSVVYTLTAQVFGVVLGFFFASGRPVVLKTWEKQGETETIKFIKLLTRFFLLLVLPTMIGFYLLRSRVLLLFTTSQYLPAERAILPLLLGFSLNNLVRFPNLAYNISKKTKRLMVLVTVVALLNVMLNLVMIPAWGYTGAAWATCISYVTYFVLNTYDGNRLLRWDFPWKSFIKISAATGVMGLGIYFLENALSSGILPLLILIAAGCAIYCVTLLIFREPGWHEIKEVSSIIAARIKRALPWTMADSNE